MNQTYAGAQHSPTGSHLSESSLIQSSKEEDGKIHQMRFAVDIQKRLNKECEGKKLTKSEIKEIAIQLIKEYLSLAEDDELEIEDLNSRNDPRYPDWAINVNRRTKSEEVEFLEFPLFTPCENPLSRYPQAFHPPFSTRSADSMNRLEFKSDADCETLAIFCVEVITTFFEGGDYREIALQEVSKISPITWRNAHKDSSNSLPEINELGDEIAQALRNESIRCFRDICVAQQAQLYQSTLGILSPELLPSFFRVDDFEAKIRAISNENKQSLIIDILKFSVGQIEKELDLLKLSPEIDTSRAEKYLESQREYIRFLSGENSSDTETISINNPYIAPHIQSAAIRYFLSATAHISWKLGIEENFEKTYDEITRRLLKNKHSLENFNSFIIAILEDKVLSRVKKAYAALPGPIKAPSDPDTLNMLVELKQSVAKLGLCLREFKSTPLDGLPKEQIIDCVTDFYCKFDLIPQIHGDPKFRSYRDLLLFLFSDLEKITIDDHALFQLRYIHSEFEDALSGIPDEKRPIFIKTQTPIEHQLPLTPIQEIEDIIASHLTEKFISSNITRINRINAAAKIKEVLDRSDVTFEVLNDILDFASCGWFPARGEQTIYFGLSQSKRSKNDTPPSLTKEQKVELERLKEEIFPKPREKKVVLHAPAAEETIIKTAAEEPHAPAQMSNEEFEIEFAKLLAEEEAQRIAKEAELKPSEEEISKAKSNLIEGLSRGFGYKLTQDQAQKIADIHPDLALSLATYSPDEIYKALRIFIRVFGISKVEAIITNEPSLFFNVVNGSFDEKALSGMITKREEMVQGTLKVDSEPNDTEPPSPTNAMNEEENPTRVFFEFSDQAKEVIKIGCSKIGSSFTTRVIKLKDGGEELQKIINYSKEVLGFNTDQTVELLRRIETKLDNPKRGRQSVIEFIEEDIKLALDAVGIRSQEVGDFILTCSGVFNSQVIKRAEDLSIFYTERGFSTSDTALALRKHKEMIAYGRENLERRLSRLESICKSHNIPFTSRDILKNYPYLLGFVNLNSDRDDRLLGILVKAASHYDDALSKAHISKSNMLNPLVLEATLNADLSCRSLDDLLRSSKDLQDRVREKHRRLGEKKNIFRIFDEWRKNPGCTDQDIIEYMRDFTRDRTQDYFSVWMLERESEERREDSSELRLI